MKRYSKRLFHMAVVMACGFCLLSLPVDAATRRQRNKEAIVPPPSPGLFARHLTLEGESGKMLALDLPAEVHAGLQRQDGKDLCVFDQNGSVLPFMLSGSGASVSRHRQDMGSLPFYTWQKSDSSRNQQTGGNTDVFIDNAGGTIRIRTEGLVDTEAKPTSLLVDTLPLKEFRPEAGMRILSSHLRMRVGNRHMVSSVRLSGSDDLASWKSLGGEQTLARLDHQGASLDRLDITLPGRTPRFIMMRFAGDEPNVEGITASLEISASTERRSEMTVAGAVSPDGKEVGYELGGGYSLQTIQLGLPGTDAISAAIFGRDGASGPWHRLGDQTLFSLNRNGIMLRNEALGVPPSMRRYRQWRLQALGPVRFAEAPAFTAAYSPVTLVFLARGQGPWTLAFGSKHAVDATPLPPVSLEELGEARVAAWPEQPASPVVSSPASQEENPEWILWLTLVLAVAVLSMLALYLLRQNASAGKP